MGRKGGGGGLAPDPCLVNLIELGRGVWLRALLGSFIGPSGIRVRKGPELCVTYENTRMTTHTCVYMFVYIYIYICVCIYIYKYTSTRAYPNPFYARGDYKQIRSIQKARLKDPREN